MCVHAKLAVIILFYLLVNTEESVQIDIKSLKAMKVNRNFIVNVNYRRKIFFDFFSTSKSKLLIEFYFKMEEMNEFGSINQKKLLFILFFHNCYQTIT